MFQKADLAGDQIGDQIGDSGLPWLCPACASLFVDLLPCLRLFAGCLSNVFPRPSHQDLRIYIPSQGALPAPSDNQTLCIRTLRQSPRWPGDKKKALAGLVRRSCGAWNLRKGCDSSLCQATLSLCLGPCTAALLSGALVQFKHASGAQKEDQDPRLEQR